MWVSLGTKPPELVDPVIPEVGEYIYSVFWELWDRNSGVSWQNIYYYQKIHDIEFTGDQLFLLRKMSETANAWIAKKEKAANSPTPGRNSKPSRQGKRGRH